MSGIFKVGREPRENHPKNAKAVLYEVQNGAKIKIGVWKPGCKTPKVSSVNIPRNALDALQNEMLAIEAEEIKAGIADY